MNTRQLKKYIIEPTLKTLDLHSDAAVNLLLGTLAQESRMGHYIHQVNGPALGIFQMEPATHDDLLLNYISYRPDLKEKIEIASQSNRFCSKDLIFNLRYAAAMCRVHYLRVPHKLPKADDIEGLATYWKQYYNTRLGRGSVEEFIENYRRYVK